MQLYCSKICLVLNGCHTQRIHCSTYELSQVELLRTLSVFVQKKQPFCNRPLKILPKMFGLSMYCIYCITVAEIDFFGHKDKRSVLIRLPVLRFSEVQHSTQYQFANFPLRMILNHQWAFNCNTFGFS